MFKALMLQLQHATERRQWQRPQVRMLPGECLVHDPTRGGMYPRIGDAVQPTPALVVQILRVAERPGQEKVLAEAAERPLDLPLGLGPIGPAGAGWSPI